MQSQKSSNTEAKRNIATHSDSSVDMTHVKRHWQPRSEMWLTFSEILHQLSIKSLFENAILRLLPTSHSKNWQSCFFRLRHFAVQCSENYSKKREKKQVPAKRRPVLRVHVKILNVHVFLMTSIFQVWKRKTTTHKPLSNTRLPFSEKV